MYRNKKKQDELDEANRAGAAAATELGELAQQGIAPSYTDSQYQVLCDALVQAMNGCGTDESAVYNVFKQMKNEADIRKLVMLFGIRYYQPCAWTSPISYAVWQANDQAYGGGIAAWLGYDLSATEIDTINEILTGNGITYKF